MRSRAAFCFVVVTGLASAQPAPKGPDGFANNYPHAGRASFWAWQWERMRDGLPKPPPGGWNLPAVRTDPETLRSPEANPSVTWIGHATMLVRLGGKNILFDPVFSERASPVGFAGPKRIVPLPIDIPELPAIDVVLISHNHYDHLDAESVKRLAAMGAGRPAFRAAGAQGWFADPRHHARRRARLVAGDAARATSHHVRAGAALEQAAAGRCQPDALGRVGGRGRGSGSSTPETPATRRISATSASASAPSTWRSFRSDRTSRAGSCRSCTSTFRRPCRFARTCRPRARSACTGARSSRSPTSRWTSRRSCWPGSGRSADSQPEEFDVLKIGETRRLLGAAAQ